MAYSILYLLLLLPIFPFLGIAQTQGNISVGATISATANASDSWLSPSGDFAFGFWETENNQFLLSIWYDKIPSKTMAWYPVEGNFVESGSKVQLTADKGLVLTSPRGDELWKSQPLSGTVSHAYMNDTGNFIIKDQNSRNLWETFDHPRDTILPFQTIERTGYLQSRKSGRDFSPGRFRLTLLENGNLVLSSVSLPTTYLNEPYYESNTEGDADLSNSGLRLVFNESGYLYVLSDNGQRLMLTDKEVYSTSNFYHRATINFDGVFTLYYHPRNNTGDETWLKLDSKPDNICLDMRGNTGSGVCGYNGICTLRTDKTPTCGCPPGYSLFDPSDKYGNCNPNFTMSCEDEALQGQYHLEESQNTDWPSSDYALLKPFTESQCRNSCLNDCMCAVAIFRENTCWKKKLPLSNGRKDSQEPSLALVKVGRANSSQRGDFAFGFSEIENNQFLLSIWYDKIPDKTKVWYPVEGKFVESGSKVQLTADKGLVLTSPTGDELWKSERLNRTVSYAYMNDTGNFIIKGQNSLNLWETFHDPRDTILPFQTIERTGFLQSRKSERDFSPGRFRLTLLENGNLVLSSVSLPTTHLNEPYYESQTADDANVSNSGVGVVFDGSGDLYVLKGNGQRFMVTENEIYSENVYHRATINSDGVFTQHHHPRTMNGDDTWAMRYAIPENICIDMFEHTGSGVCGYNGICSLGDKQRPTCGCPPGYSFLDPSDTYGNCRPNFTIGCEDKDLQVHYKLEDLQSTDWPTSDYALLQPFNESQCRDSCLNDCMCAVAIFRHNTCWKKKLPLSNGRTDTKEASLMLIKVGTTNSSQKNPYIPPEKDNKDGFIVTGSVLLGTSVLINLIFVLAIYLGFASIYKKKKNVITPQVESNLGCFTYKELVEATGGFKEELGRGAFGIVYKGEMKTSCGEFVAVKKLDGMIQEGDKEFKAEVDIIGRTHHKNLVRLFGFCNEGANRLLVYEYLSNGSLSDFLFQNQKPGWNQRIEIIFGIARGLAYLHEECSTQIIHCDIKPQNILLDNFHNARISDFGLAKLLNIGQSYTNTGIRGTKGYVAPEWFRNQPITVKVDVFSFGVLLLEIIFCKRNVDQERYEDTSVLTDWVYDSYVEGRLDNVVDDDVEALRDWKRLERFTMVALWCIQEDVVLRPSMKKVIQMLDGVVDVNVPPCPSPFAVSNTSVTLYHG